MYPRSPQLPHGNQLTDSDIKPRADLKGTDLKGADLRGADLRDANLAGAYLRGTTLWGANLDRALGVS